MGIEFGVYRNIWGETRKEGISTSPCPLLRRAYFAEVDTKAERGSGAQASLQRRGYSIIVKKPAWQFEQIIETAPRLDSGFHGHNKMAIPLFIFLILSLGSLTHPAFIHAEETWVSYEVTIAEDNLATMTADLMLAAPPETVYAVLSDYPKWPDIFAQSPSINTIERVSNQVRVDMTLKVSFLPIGLKLVTDTREIPTSVLNTTLVEGDFEQYDWVWTLRPALDSEHAKASVVVHVQPSVWIPHWLLEWVLTSGFTDHFHKLRDAVEVRYREHGRTPVISAPPNSP